MSRFMLNLRRAVFDRDSVQITGQTRSPMMDNLGEWLVDDSDDDDRTYDYELAALQNTDSASFSDARNIRSGPR